MDEASDFKAIQAMLARTGRYRKYGDVYEISYDKLDEPHGDEAMSFQVFDGYNGFFCQFRFDLKGQLLSVKAYE